MGKRRNPATSDQYLEISRFPRSGFAGSGIYFKDGDATKFTFTDGPCWVKSTGTPFKLMTLVIEGQIEGFRITFWNLDPRFKAKFGRVHSKRAPTMTNSRPMKSKTLRNLRVETEFLLQASNLEANHAESLLKDLGS